MVNAKNLRLPVMIGMAAAAFWITGAIAAPQLPAAEPSRDETAAQLPPEKKAPPVEEIIEQRERADKALDESDRAQLSSGPTWQSLKTHQCRWRNAKL